MEVEPFGEYGEVETVCCSSRSRSPRARFGVDAVLAKYAGPRGLLPYPFDDGAGDARPDSCGSYSDTGGGGPPNLASAAFKLLSNLSLSGSVMTVLVVSASSPVMIPPYGIVSSSSSTSTALRDPPLGTLSLTTCVYPGESSTCFSFPLSLCFIFIRGCVVNRSLSSSRWTLDLDRRLRWIVFGVLILRLVVGVSACDEGWYLRCISDGVLMLDSENVVFFSVRLSSSLHWVQMNLPSCQYSPESVSRHD
jgi:hypothetical protein